MASWLKRNKNSDRDNEGKKIDIVYNIPEWLREIDYARLSKSMIILENNIFDSYLYSGLFSRWAGSNSMIYDNLNEALDKYLRFLGYELVIFYDPINKFQINDKDREHPSIIESLKVYNQKHSHEAHSTSGQADIATSVLNDLKIIKDQFFDDDKSKDCLSAFIFNFGSRFIRDFDQLDLREHQLLVHLLSMSLDERMATHSNGVTINKLMLLLCNRHNDLAPWLGVENPSCKIISISHPDKDIRKKFFELTKNQFYTPECIDKKSSVDDLNIEKYANLFANLTDGMLLKDLLGIQNLCQEHKIPIHRITDAINLAKYGVKTSPWEKLSEPDKRNKNIQGIKAIIQNRVFGQEEAIEHTMDVVVRAICGMSGILHSKEGIKPRGILFYAGPTGVGKTEMAKALAEALFGSEDQLIRLDMSEYGQEHSGERLLGAPPGYVGYNRGGELTNAVKKKPFSVVLFDEIEKMHKSIWDKFLGILEDGRLTDGLGETVYFGETILVFTSNLGSDQGTIQELGVVDTYKANIQEEIKKFFHKKLKRPEIKNRIGENIIVFNRINSEIGKNILDKHLKRSIEKFKQSFQLNSLEIENGVRKFLVEMISQNFIYGARGIANILETIFINKVTRALAGQNAHGGDWVVCNLNSDEAVVNRKEKGKLV